MSRYVRSWGRLVGAASVLGVLVWRLGTGPFLDGIHTVSWWSLAAAAGIALVTTACCAWRWRLVARGEGIHWPAVDEDISVASILAGRPSAESAPRCSGG